MPLKDAFDSSGFRLDAIIFQLHERSKLICSVIQSSEPSTHLQHTTFPQLGTL